MGMAEPLGKILVQLSGGGGATKLNIDAGGWLMVGRGCTSCRAIQVMRYNVVTFVGAVCGLGVEARGLMVGLWK